MRHPMLCNGDILMKSTRAHKEQMSQRTDRHPSAVTRKTVIFTFMKLLQYFLSPHQLISVVVEFCFFCILVFAEQAADILSCCLNTNFWEKKAKQESRVSWCCNLRDHQCFWSEGSQTDWWETQPGWWVTVRHASISRIFASKLNGLKYEIFLLCYKEKIMMNWFNEPMLSPN